MAGNERSGPEAPALGADVATRLATLAGRYSLDRRQARQLSSLLAVLASDEHAPTTVRDPTRALDVHLADSLAGLEVEAVRRARTACDLGAGAGFPGLPLAVALPSCQITLVESAQRKCRFLGRMVDAAKLENAAVACTRAEQWQAGVGRQDAVFARALAPAPVVLEYAAPLLHRGGLLVDWRGAHGSDEDAHAAAAAAAVGLRRLEVWRTEPFPAARALYLHLYLKVRDTPDRFPRRPGIARKRPLGASGLG